MTAAKVSLPPIYCHHPSRFHIPEGNASNTPALSFMTSDFISVHLSSSENWIPMVSPLILSTPQPVLSMKSQTLIITRSPLLPRHQCLTSCSSCGDLSNLDCSTVSSSLHFLLILFLVLPTLSLKGGRGINSLTSTFDSVTSLAPFLIVLVLLSQKLDHEELSGDSSLGR